ncbi:MAG: prolyl oligopeptidase family serine peptidase [Ardenticatenaceae bacterium]|nr:prolyl oligopeptidase family serine peptidase [Ardenticatenaceae bacterium]
MTNDPFLQQLLSLPTVMSAELSPDGRWVAFVWYRVHENLDVFAVPTNGSAPPVALSHTPEATQFVSWTPDSGAVIVAEDHDGDERARLFRVDLDRPGELQPLTEAHPPYFVRGGGLRPDERTLFYGANYDFRAGKVITPTWIYRHDLRTGERVPIARPQRPAYTVPDLNRPGTHVLYSRKDRHPSGRQFYLVDVEGREDREILNFGDAVKVSASWFPDGERILVLSESHDGRPQTHMSLGVYHWPSGTMRWLLDDPDRDLESAWVSPDGTIVVDEVREARHRPTFLDAVTGAETPFPRLPGNFLPEGRTVDGAWIGLYYSATSPTDLVRFEPAAQSPSDLMSLTRVWERTNLDPQHLAPAEEFRWPSVDGLTIQGWLYQAHPNPRRAIIYVHGGPTSHSEDRLNPQIQYLVSRGFNVLDVNYRGSTGFGLTFREAIKVDGWGGREQADIATGAEALIRAGLAGSGQVGLTGTSYGGYSSWYLITHARPKIIAAAAPICGMTDLVVDYTTTRPDLRPYSEEMLGGSPEQVPERYYERSPINFVENIRGKVLIVQGAQDPNVTPENVRQVVERLERRQIPHELLVFEDEGHGIKKPANQTRLFVRLAEFFDEALGPNRREPCHSKGRGAPADIRQVRASLCSSNGNLRRGGMERRTWNDE